MLASLCDSASGLTGNEMCYRFRSTSSVKSLVVATAGTSKIVKDHRSAYEEWISETI